MLPLQFVYPTTLRYRTLNNVEYDLEILIFSLFSLSLKGD